MVEESRDKARKILVRCIEKDRIDTMKQIVEAGFDIDDWILYPGTTLLMQAAALGSNQFL